MAARFSHRGICVADIDASVRFYRDALGFEAQEDHPRLEGAWLDAGTDISGAALRAQMLRNAAGITIELLYFHAPAATGRRTRRALNQFGLTHFAVNVDDMDAAIERIVAAGGQVHPATRVYYDVNDAEIVYTNDTDGVRIELVHSPRLTAGFSHSGICVADPAQAARFYAVLGFLPADNVVLLDHTAWLAPLTEAEDARIRATVVRDDQGNAIELMSFATPDSFGSRERRPLNQYGLTHHAFWVDDIDAAAAALVEAGGRVFPSTRSRYGDCEMLHLADVDGVRVELMQQL
ncbi:hypothetical protein ACFB49_08210 [Sphingomonas sp. DBB INV C78]|uniref:VOC family protein n=1 Tax=Sphingomonas sp. DBB INV C78 TaxID=3349434 RepID=UPI0036D2EBFF